MGGLAVGISTFSILHSQFPLSPSGSKFGVDVAEVYVVVGDRHHGVIEQIRHFPCNFIGSVVFAGHHDLSSFFANLLEDFVVATFK